MKTYNVTAKREIHGMTKSPEYISWYSAKTRVLNKNRGDIKWYETLTMSEEWQRSFLVFYRDMGTRPPNTTLERIDNSKGYEAGNCRWATRKEQANNRRVRTEYHRDTATGKFIQREG